VDYGTAVTQWITNSPLSLGTGTQAVCRTGAVVGNAYTLVSATNVTLTVTNDATLTWSWGTEVWLDAEAGAGGSVDAADAWVQQGSNITVTALPGMYYYFTHWSGDTGAISVGSTNHSQVVLQMNNSLQLVAHFNPDESVPINDISQEGDDIRIQWASTNDWLYLLESKENLMISIPPWTNVGPLWVAGTNGSTSRLDLITDVSPGRFYRVMRRPLPLELPDHKQ
jgi:hypothetical protein